MNETNNTVVSDVTETQETPVAEYDDWDDIDFSDVTDNDPDAEVREAGSGDQEADQPEGPQEAPEKQEPAEDDPQTAKQEETDQSFTLKHLDTVRTVGRDEVIALAQKGLDYDRIREDREKAHGEVQRLTALEDFLKELAAPNGMTVDDLMDTTRASLLAEREGLDPDVALQRVKLEKDRRTLEADKQTAARQTEADRQRQAEDQRRRESIDRFVKGHPDLHAQDIPKEVWDAFAGGKDLADAYALHENKTLKENVSRLEQELATMKQNTKNQKRSTGSQTTAGAKQESEDDRFDKLWYDGT